MQPTRIRRSAFPVALVLGLVSLAVVADTFTVPIDFRTIQEAIDAVSDGDCISVEPGTYNENIFLDKAITVQSTGGKDVTIIDGSDCTRGVSSCSVVTFAPGDGEDSVLDGFTVTGGEGTLVGSPRGGGIYCVNTASPTIVNCAISENEASSGGGMANFGASSPTLINCTISRNLGTFGGGMYSNFSSPTLTNCTISDNKAFLGGGIANRGSSPTLTNSTVSGNSADSSGGGMWSNLSGSSPTLTNCVFWGNSFLEIVSSSGAVTTVTFSDIQGGYVGIGNIDLDPRFVNPDQDDYHLRPGSPCINLGTNFAPDLPLTDIDGDSRIIGCDVDMGVDEAPQFDPSCDVTFIRGDCNGDQDFAPLVDAIFLLNFGFVLGSPAPRCLDACDVDDNGVFTALVDGIYILSFGFVPGSPMPPPPHPFCGSDPTPDGVTCDGFTSCP